MKPWRDMLIGVAQRALSERDVPSARKILDLYGELEPNEARSRESDDGLVRRVREYCRRPTWPGYRTAARDLGVSKSTLHDLCEEHDIRPGRTSDDASEPVRAGRPEAATSDAGRDTTAGGSLSPSPQEVSRSESERESVGEHTREARTPTGRTWPIRGADLSDDLASEVFAAYTPPLGDGSRRAATLDDVLELFAWEGANKPDASWQSVDAIAKRVRTWMVRERNKAASDAFQASKRPGVRVGLGPAGQPVSPQRLQTWGEELGGELAPTGTGVR